MNMKGLNLDARSAAAGGVAGIVIGAGATYLALNHTFKARLDKEVLSLKEHYGQRIDVLELMARGLPDMEVSATGDEDHRPPAMGNYATEVAAEPDSDPGGVEPEISPAIVEAAEAMLKSPEHIAYIEQERQDRITSKAYVISEEEWLEGEKGFQQITVTFYSGDGVLVDDKEQPIPDIVRTVGMLNASLFGIESNDPSIRYVRNEKLEVDFEIILRNAAYVDEVLNYGRPGRRERDGEQPPGA